MSDCNKNNKNYKLINLIFQIIFFRKWDNHLHNPKETSLQRLVHELLHNQRGHCRPMLHAHMCARHHDRLYLQRVDVRCFYVFLSNATHVCKCPIFTLSLSVAFFFLIFTLFIVLGSSGMLNINSHDSRQVRKFVLFEYRLIFRFVFQVI